MKSILLFACFIPLTGLGRIGETPDECAARYGPETKIENATGKFYSDYPQHCFTFNNILIRVRFLNGKSAQEEFYSHHALEERRTEILESNSKRATGVAVVVKETGDRITITTKEFDALMRKELGTGEF